MIDYNLIRSLAKGGTAETIRQGAKALSNSALAEKIQNQASVLLGQLSTRKPRLAKAVEEGDLSAIRIEEALGKLAKGEFVLPEAN